MRLISQDSTMNFPMEYTVVMREANTILAFTVESPFHRIIAEYSCEEVAKAAMRDLNKRNERSCIWYRMPTEDELCAKSKPSTQGHLATVTC